MQRAKPTLPGASFRRPSAAKFSIAPPRRLPAARKTLRAKFAMSARQPLGVCALVTPWNFPMAIPSWKIMPALICGNTVVIKPAEDTPLSTYNLVQILIEAGLPAGVVNIVTGMGPDAGAPLVTHPGVAAIS